MGTRKEVWLNSPRNPDPRQLPARQDSPGCLGTPVWPAGTCHTYSPQLPSRPRSGLWGSVRQRVLAGVRLGNLTGHSGRHTGVCVWGECLVWEVGSPLSSTCHWLGHSQAQGPSEPISVPTAQKQAEEHVDSHAERGIHSHHPSGWTVCASLLGLPGNFLSSSFWLLPEASKGVCICGADRAAGVLS